MTTLQEDAKSTLDYLEEHGWYQGSGAGPNGEVCLAEAVDRACKTPQRWARLIEAISVQVKETTFLVPLWNDAPERDYSDIVSVLKEIIDS